MGKISTDKDHAGRYTVLAAIMVGSIMGPIDASINVGMVLGIATGGAVLCALTPSYILQKDCLEHYEAARFLSALKYAYITGTILTGLAAATSLVRYKGKNKEHS